MDLPFNYIPIHIDEFAEETISDEWLTKIKKLYDGENPPTEENTIN